MTTYKFLGAALRKSGDATLSGNVLTLSSGGVSTDYTKPDYKKWVAPRQKQVDFKIGSMQDIPNKKPTVSMDIIQKKL